MTDSQDVAEATIAAPRRSSRITSQSKAPEATTATKRSSSKKRSAAASGATEDVGLGSGDKKATSSKRAKKGTGAETEGEDGSGAADDASPKLDPIEIGDSLPSVILKNEKGEDVDVRELAAEKGLVLFLVPKADTPGCTTQACGFRDIYPDFTGVNFDVYCLSADSPSAQTKWQTKKQLPYPLLSDTKRILITALGAGAGGKTKRSHFIFKKGGELVDKKNPVKPADSPKLALEFVKSLS